MSSRRKTRYKGKQTKIPKGKSTKMTRTRRKSNRNRPGWWGDKIGHRIAALKGQMTKRKKSVRTVSNLDPTTGRQKVEVRYEFQDPKKAGPFELDEIIAGADLKGPYGGGRGGTNKVKLDVKGRPTGEVELSGLDINARKGKKSKKRSRNK